MFTRWRAGPASLSGIATAWFALSLAVTVFAALATTILDMERGLVERVYAAPGLSGDVLGERLAVRPDLERLRLAGLPDRYFSARWTGVWRVPADGLYVFRLGADDGGRLVVDGEVVLERGAESGFRTVSAQRHVARGFHPIDVTYEQLGGGAFLVVEAGREGTVPRTLDALEIYPTEPTARQLRQQAAARVLRRLMAVAWAVMLALACLGGARHLQRVGPGQFFTQGTIRRVAPVLGIACLTAWAGLIRLEALTGRYGRVASPRWALALQDGLVDAGPALHPARVTWGPVETPYVGGDPIAYLAEARAMTHFFQASVREPVFPATTRGFLALLRDQNVAVSFASATYSTLLVPATYLLGTSLGPAFGPAAGLLAAALLAGEFTAIDWGIDGWRDDASAVFAVLVTWSLLRLRRGWTRTNAMLAGVVAAAAMLTRLTMLVLFVPGLALVVLFGHTAPRGRRAALGGLALAVAAVLVAPYLIACARAYGDPLYAINYHTVFYRARDHVTADEAQSAVRYLAERLRARPIGTLDTVLFGLTGYPFVNKWTGFRPWAAWLGPTFAACALVGGFLWLLSSTGRLLIALLLLALLPFAFTWQIPGGAEWRFTLLAYPFYLLAASAVLVSAFSGLRAARGDLRTRVRHLVTPRWPVPILPAVLLAVVLAVALAFLPWLVLREAFAGGSGLSIRAGDRGDVIFTSGWQAVTDGQCLVARSGDARLSLPLARPGPYRVVLRLALHPSSTTEQQVVVRAGGHDVGRARLSPEERNQVAAFSLGSGLLQQPATPIRLVAEGRVRPFLMCGVEVVRVP